MLASLILALRRRQTCAKAYERFGRTLSKAGDDADEVADEGRRRLVGRLLPWIRTAKAMCVEIERIIFN